jgi:hypothetical protein
MKAHPCKTYTGLAAAYQHFNRALFGGTLPACLITYQRHKGAYGYFIAQNLANTTDKEDVTDEIALNPSHFDERGEVDTLSTLVHEMAHLWQHHFGKPSRGGYHNREWATKMHEIGLVPDSIDKPGTGTGQKVSHVIEPGGRFETVCKAYLARRPALLYRDRHGEGGRHGTGAAGDRAEKKRASKTKYTCPGCELNAWARPGVVLICGDCTEELEAEDA